MGKIYCVLNARVVRGWFSSVAQDETPLKHANPTDSVTLDGRDGGASQRLPS